MQFCQQKKRLSGEYISQKPPEIEGVGSSSPPGKEKYLLVCTPKSGHEKTPKPLGYRGFPVQYLFWLHNMVKQRTTHLSKHNSKNVAKLMFSGRKRTGFS